MPRITVTYDFADQDEFAKHFGVSFPSDDAPVKAMPTSQPASTAAQPVASQPAVATTQSVAPQSALAPQPGAATAATATVAQCAEAFQRHVKKGGGRSAMTARKAVTDALPTFQNFQALTPEECAMAVAAMDRATDAA